MTPKEKAEELFMTYVDKGMNQIKPVINRDIRKEIAKQCALIAVDEMLNNDGWSSSRDEWSIFKKYCEEVKEELLKL
jgi:hypothetical protein